MLSEIRQRKTYCMISLTCKILRKEKSQIHGNKVEWWLPDTGKRGKGEI